MLQLIAAALSLAIHLALALTLLHVTAKSPPPPPKHTEWNYGSGESAIHLRGAELPSEVTVTPPADKGITATGQDCPDKSYVGIGIVVNPGIDLVTLVGTNTPASRAGLKAGDILLDADLARDATIGRVVPLKVLRDGLQFDVSVTVARICQD